MLKRISLVLLSVLSCLLPVKQVQAVIIETNEIATVRDYVDENCLVFFNLTGTLYESSTTLGSHQWREYFAEKVECMIAEGMISEAAGHALINKVKREIVLKVPKRPVEEITPQLITDLQEAKIPVFGITKKAMAVPYADDFGLITSNHLESIGIHLEKTLSYFKGFEETRNQFYSFAYGILFTGRKSPHHHPLDSVACLAHLFSDNHYLDDKNSAIPKIVMVDNSTETLSSMNWVFGNANFVGLRYGRADVRKADFNPILGIIQFVAFFEYNRIMSDEEAAQVYLNHPHSDGPIEEEQPHINYQTYFEMAICLYSRW